MFLKLTQKCIHHEQTHNTTINNSLNNRTPRPKSVPGRAQKYEKKTFIHINNLIKLINFNQNIGGHCESKDCTEPP